MSSRPTLLLVHGSWHTPEHFAPVRKAFGDKGWDTVCPRQPGPGSLPPVGLLDDARCIGDELNRLIEHEGWEVIVIAHSYGGMITTQSAHASLAKSERAKTGKPGGIVHLIYLCAFLPRIDRCLVDTFGDTVGASMPPQIPEDEDHMCMMSNPEATFYHDLPPAEQKHWASKLIRCPVDTQLRPVTYQAYLYHPTTYVFCTQDQALPIQIQRRMVDDATKDYNIKIGTEELDTSHSPFLSSPEGVVNIVEKLWSKDSSKC